ncbi:hypothetical protein EGX98_11095 [Fusobacterium necrophorum]|uniref:Copper resistance protein B n=1 Tax=Fusobacterium necrophorum BL TaxID=1441732 RepID=A0AB73BUI1_9FUSO|nr:hypothetical protein [Fusobacterium necrophorum]AYZ74525.1 hypothetical protein EGX98_11095 [Fusobacterium necrophorum]AZW09592.1 hypothetical protein EO219_08485 [Fusobacterium necrophorum subsp. necrophorum]KDE60965.1 hypothetical protein FUSO3_11430 [Fusobacterium necrophorum BL]KDE69006.1 hypothetical protein FUSO7_12325 [Fusobacterium necrophorum BFTR-2]SDB16402.1 hypothetical protein SAMN02983009_00764 [Fusobacterium necrophorum]
MSKKLIFLLPLISINLCAEGYSTNMPVEADPEEIFEDLQIKAVAGISEYELKEKNQITENAVEFFQNDRIYYISAEYNQLQKKTEKKDSKNKEFNFREKNRNFLNAQLFYQPSDENYLIGYEYKGIEKLKNLHSLIIGYTTKDNHFFINPYIEENKTGVKTYKNNGEKKKKNIGGVNLQTYLKMPVSFTDRLYGTVDFNFKGSEKKELGIGLYMPYKMQITDSASLELNLKVKYYKEVNNEKNSKEDESQRFVAKVEPIYNFTENVFIRSEVGYVAAKKEKGNKKDEFSVGVGIGFKF